MFGEVTAAATATAVMTGATAAAAAHKQNADRCHASWYAERTVLGENLGARGECRQLFSARHAVQRRRKLCLGSRVPAFFGDIIRALAVRTRGTIGAFFTLRPRCTGLTLDTLRTGITFVTFFAGIAFLTLRALDSLRAAQTFFLLFGEIFKAHRAVGTFFALRPLQALFALWPGVTFVALIALFTFQRSKLCGGKVGVGKRISFVTFIAFVAGITFFPLDTLNTLQALFAAVAFFTAFPLLAFVAFIALFALWALGPRRPFRADRALNPLLSTFSGFPDWALFALFAFKVGR